MVPVTFRTTAAVDARTEALETRSRELDEERRHRQRAEGEAAAVSAALELGKSVVLVVREELQAQSEERKRSAGKLALVMAALEVYVDGGTWRHGGTRPWALSTPRDKPRA